MKRSPFDGWAVRDGIALAYPRNAVAAQLVAGAAAWAYPANYTTVVAAASMGAAFMPSMLQATILFDCNQWASNQNEELFAEIELTTGAAGSEVFLGRFVYAIMWNSTLGVGYAQNPYVGGSRRVGPTLIPAGTRIAARMRGNRINTQVIYSAGIYLEGYEGAVPIGYPPYPQQEHSEGVHRSQTLATPTGSLLNITPGRPFTTWSAPVEVIAVATGDLLVHGVAAGQSEAALAQSAYLQIGTGVLNSEVWRAQLSLPAVVPGCMGGYFEFDRPRFVKKGERLAAHMTGGMAVDSVHHLMFQYEEM